MSIGNKRFYAESNYPPTVRDKPGGNIEMNNFHASGGNADMNWPCDPAAPAPGSGSREAEHRSLVEMRVPATSRYIGVVREMVDAVSAETNLSPMDRAAVRLAVGEACNNAVIHAEPRTRSDVPQITVICWVRPDALQIDITNDGNGYVPVWGGKMPEPMAESGRGMALIEAMMDSVDSFAHHGKTTVRMHKRVTPAPNPARE